jgi:hypothetical protein
MNRWHRTMKEKGLLKGRISWLLGNKGLVGVAKDGEVGIDGEPGKAEFGMTGNFRGVADEDTGLFPRRTGRREDLVEAVLVSGGFAKRIVLDVMTKIRRTDK